MERTISFTLNGKPTNVTVDDERMLLWVLRSDLGLTGTKFGCGAALCGACTVIVNQRGRAVLLTPVKDIAGKQVLTIEGLGQDGQAHPIQQAFLKHHAFQCGFCTPGMIINAYALLLKTPQADARRDHRSTWTTTCAAAARMCASWRPSGSRGADPGRCAMKPVETSGHKPARISWPRQGRDCSCFFHVERAGARQEPARLPSGQAVPHRFQRLPAHRRRWPRNVLRRQGGDGAGRDDRAGANAWPRSWTCPSTRWTW